MANVLSQQDIDGLLLAINQPPEIEEEYRGVYEIPKYDFRRPNIVNRKQLMILRDIYSELAKSLTQYYSSIGQNNQYHLSSIDHETFEEFSRTTPDPSPIHKIRIEKEFIYVNHDDHKEDFNIKKFIELHQKAWAKYAFLDSSLEKTDKCIVPFLSDYYKNEMTLSIILEEHVSHDNERLFLIILPNAFIRTVKNNLTFENSIFNGNVMQLPYNKYKHIKINLILYLKKDMTLRDVYNNIKVNNLLKFSKIEMDINDKILAVGLYKNNKFFIDEIINEERGIEKMNTMVGNIQDVDVQVSVELGRTKKAVKDILQIGEGTIIELDKNAGDPVDIYVNNIKYARGEVVTVDDDYGVRITEILASNNSAF